MSLSLCVYVCLFAIIKTRPSNQGCGLGLGLFHVVGRDVLRRARSVAQYSRRHPIQTNLP